MNYCDECGNTITRQADHDPMCYLSAGNHMPYCDNCGDEPTVTAVFPIDGRYFMLCQRCQLPSKIHASCEAVEAR